MNNGQSAESNKLALEIIRARRWLWMMYHSGEPVVGERKTQCEFTLTWIQMQQKILDALEKWSC